MPVFLILLSSPEFSFFPADFPLLYFLKRLLDRNEFGIDELWMDSVSDWMTFINIWSNHPHHLARLSACLVSFFSIFMPICFPFFSFRTGFASRLSFDQDEAYEEKQQCYVVECEEYLKIIWARVECLSKKIFVWLGYFIQLKDSHCVCISFILLDMLAFCRQWHRQRKCQHVNICVCGVDFFVLLNLIFNIRYTTI